MNRICLSLTLLALCLGGSLCTAAPARAEMKTDVEFAKVDGVSLTLDAHIPDGPGPFPTAILVHGGGFVRGDKQSYIKPIFEPLSQAGFTWFTINYRLAPQYRYPAGVEDVERAIRWVKDHTKEYKVDPKRIVLIGESAGGHMVSMVGARAKGKTRVAAVVPFYAPNDLEMQVKARGQLGESMTALFGLTELNEAAWKTLRDGSPSSYIRKGMAPHLLIHGTKDAQVPYEQSVRFQAAMRSAGNVCELYTVPDGGHGMGGWDKAHPQYKSFMIEWIKRTLEK